jgi:phosphoglycerate dehydrogenase-like enzyme
VARPKVYVQRAGPWYTQFMTAANEAALSSFADIVSPRDREVALRPEEIIDGLRGCRAVLSLNGYGASEMDAAVIGSARSLELICIAHYWGWGHFTGVKQATGVPVIEGSNAGTIAVAEWVIAAALLGVRKLHTFDRVLKSGSAWGGPRGEAGMLSGRRAGLIGLGRVGLYTAHYFKALGVEVVAYSKSCPPDKAAALGIELTSLDTLLSTAQVICLNHRLTDAARGLLGAREFALIKPGALFINAARAGLYDEALLIRELKTARFSACLDVFAVEPLTPDHPFRSMPNVLITPHIAGNNPAMFQRCARESITTLKNYFEGRGIVDQTYAIP